MTDKANDTERQATVYKEKLKKLQLIIDSGKAKPEPTEMGAVKCVCCCRRMGRAGTSNLGRGFKGIDPAIFSNLKPRSMTKI